MASFAVERATAPVLEFMGEGSVTPMKTGDGPEPSLVDGIININHNLTLDITEYPLERRISISDQAVFKPPRLRVEFLTSDITFPPNNRASYTRIVDSYDRIRYVMEHVSLVNVITSLHHYRSLLVVNADIPQNVSTGSALRCMLEFQQINLVDVEGGISTVGLGDDDGFVDNSHNPVKDRNRTDFNGFIGVEPRLISLPPPVREFSPTYEPPTNF